MHKHSPCLNERHGMEGLAFEPADEAGGVKPSLNAGSLAFKGGVAHLRARSSAVERRLREAEAPGSNPGESSNLFLMLLSSLSL